MLKKLIIVITLVLVASSCSQTVINRPRLVVVGNFSETGGFAPLAFSGVEFALEKLEIEDEYILDHLDISLYPSEEELEAAILESDADIYIGPSYSSDLPTVYPVYKANELFAFIPSASADTINEEDDYVFRFITSTHEQGVQFARLMEVNHYDDVAIIYEDANLAYSQVLSEGIEAEIPELVSSLNTTSAETSTDTLDSYISDETDAIILVMSAKTAGITVQRLRSVDINIPIYISSWAQSNTLIEFVADYTENLYVYSNGFPSKTSNYLSLNEEYLAFYGSSMGLPAMFAYDFIVVLNDYVKAGHDIEKDEFKSYMLENPQQEGYLFDLELNEYGMGTQAMQLVEIRDGVFVNAYD